MLGDQVRTVAPSSRLFRNTSSDQADERSPNYTLAYMELFMAVGSVFRRFNFEVYDTDVSDVELAHDFFLPSPKLDSKGVQVKVTEVNT